jgi:hypothetical protein
MARRSARFDAPRAPRQGNPVLATFAVFLLLGCIALGVLFYLEKDKTKKAQDEAKTAVADKEKTLKDLGNHENIYEIILRAYLNPDDALLEDQALKEAREKYAAMPDDQRPAWLKSIVEYVEGDFTQGQPAKPGKIFASGYPKTPSSKAEIAAFSVEKAMQRERQRADAEVANRKTVEGNLAKLQGAFTAYQNNFNKTVFDAAVKAAVDPLEALILKLNEQIKADNKAYAMKLAGLQADLVAAGKQIKQDSDTVDREREKSFNERVQARAKEIAADQERRRVEQPVVHVNEPRGKILAAEKSGEYVYINLGSNHRVFEGLTFSVHALGPGNKAVPEPKAKIKVVSVVGKEMSMCRVTDMAKPSDARYGMDPDMSAYWVSEVRDFWKVRNPLHEGELIFNPAWRPNSTVIVALNGVIDLNGDGRDDSLAFRRILESRGAKVVAWLEPTEGYKMLGRVDHNVEFLVQGLNPGFDVAKPVEGEKPRLDPYQQMEADAKSRGVEIVSLRQFLTRMGYSDLNVNLAGNRTEMTAPPVNGDKKPPMKPEMP